MVPFVSLLPGLSQAVPEVAIKGDEQKPEKHGLFLPTARLHSVEFLSMIPETVMKWVCVAGGSGEEEQKTVSSCVALKMNNAIAGCVLSTRALLPLGLQQPGEEWGEEGRLGAFCEVENAVPGEGLDPLVERRQVELFIGGQVSPWERSTKPPSPSSLEV